MNEVEIIRQQLALERAHVGTVANACANAMQGDAGAKAPGDALWQFRRACVDYLACVLAWFEERDQRLADLGADAGRLLRRLHAPVGLPLGGRSPESIALAIIAQLHAFLHGVSLAAPMDRPEGVVRQT